MSSSWPAPPGAPDVSTPVVAARYGTRTLLAAVGVVLLLLLVTAVVVALRVRGVEEREQPYAPATEARQHVQLAAADRGGTASEAPTGYDIQVDLPRTG